MPTDILNHGVLTLGGAGMIVFGVRRRAGDEFADRCLSSIVTYGGKDALILTSEKSDPGEAAKELLDKGADVGEVDALVLMDGAVEILDSEFAHRLGQALAGEPTPGLICLADADADIDDAFVILSRDVVRRWRLDQDARDGRPGYAERLREWARANGRPIAYQHFGVSLNRTHTSTLDRLNHVLAAARQGTWIERIGDAMRHQAQRHRPPGAGVSAPDAGPLPPLPEPAADRRSTAYQVPERPELLCHLPAEARSVLVMGHQPDAIAEVIDKATHAETTCLVTPGDPASYRPGLDLGAGDALPFAPGQFDAIILADALAHVRDPDRLLARLLPHLAPGGRVIASFPNAKHWTHTLPLLLNDQVRYGGASLLSGDSPVRLFTLVEATQLFDRAGLTTYHFCNGTRYPADDPPQLDGLIEWFAVNDANPEDARTMLTCYQYVLVTSRGT